jgi:predicted amidohydrolase
MRATLRIAPFLAALIWLSVAHAAQRDAAPSVKVPGQTLRVAAVQMRSTRNLSENVAAIRRHLEKCKADGARVAVFPECALSGYFDADYMKHLAAEQLADAEEKVTALCRELDIYAIIGTATREGERLLDSAIVVDPRGRIIERYHKLQLAENWPEAGDHLSVFPIDGVKCSIIICHDERYPELVRLPVLAGARVIFYVSHESGIRQEQKIDPYRAQIQARAMENGVWVVHANAPANADLSGSHGQSRVIAPDGRIVQEATMFGEEAVVATLELSRATGALARNSVKRGPLQAWWEAGIKQVRIVE